MLFLLPRCHRHRRLLLLFLALFFMATACLLLLLGGKRRRQQKNCNGLWPTKLNLQFISMNSFLNNSCARRTLVLPAHNRVVPMPRTVLFCQTGSAISTSRVTIIVVFVPNNFVFGENIINSTIPTYESWEVDRKSVGNQTIVRT